MTTRRVAVRIVRILALLERKTLSETKNRTLKCLKWNQAQVELTDFESESEVSLKSKS